jgi:DNA repair photolyase
VAKEQLFEIARRTFDTPEFRGIECIEVEAHSVINKVRGTYLPFDWTINPYRGCMHACVYCFARPTHTYLDMNAGRDFETKVVVKVNAPEVLRRELAAKRWKGEHIAMGTNMDPYQRIEGRYRLMRGIIEALIDHRNPFSILTKGTLITRDLDLLVRAAEHAPVSAAFSIGTLDEEVWRATEPGTPTPRARIEALRALVDAGIPTGVLMAPILPGISDQPDQMRAVVEAALDAGASHVSPIMLHLRPGVREEFMPRELLYCADEAFFSGTAVEITPITSVDQIQVGDGQRGPITEAVQKAFFDLVHGKVPDTRGWFTPVRAAAAKATQPAKA